VKLHDSYSCIFADKFSNDYNLIIIFDPYDEGDDCKSNGVKM